jgi:hypothetical protein
MPAANRFRRRSTFFTCQFVDQSEDGFEQLAAVFVTDGNHSLSLHPEVDESGSAHRYHREIQAKSGQGVGQHYQSGQ